MVDRASIASPRRALSWRASQYAWALANTIAAWLGVKGYPPAVLFAVGLLFVILVLLHYSTVISRLSDQNVVLAQRLALLETRLSEREDRS